MKTFLFRLFKLSVAVVTCTMLLLGCAYTSNVVTARLDEKLSLHIGQTASVVGEELQIKFLEVIADSRCPKGVTCIWEGEVSCMVEITYRESLHRVTITEPGLTNWPHEKSFKEYKITYHVEPYPEAGTEIAEHEYQLQLKVSK